MEMKQDKRGKHGNCGRKPTGRIRNEKLALNFTHDERMFILKKVEESGLTQSDFILQSVEEMF